LKCWYFPAEKGFTMTQTQQTPEPGHDPQLVAFLAWFDRIEDRLIIASLPVVLASLFLWAIAAAFPVIGTALNLVISLLVLLTTCVVLLRLVEIIWRWVVAAMAEEDDAFLYIFGIIGAAGLVIGGVACLISTVMQAGAAGDARTALFVGLLLVLVVQYRAIIVRRLFANKH
jgi:hypothetical protein